MIAELGHLFAFMALACAVAQSVLGLAAAKLDPTGVAVRRVAVTTGTLTLLAFVALIIAFVRLDFSVALVAGHSHSQKPLMYQIAGAWGNHEGSMLLWCVITAGYGSVAALVMHGGALRDKTLGVQGLLTVGSLAYLLFASSPFTRLDPAPMDGGGLNPLLQDPALILHPPFLYLGYVGFSLVFSLAAAGLITGQVDREWARRVRPWVLMAWSGLTIGIALGSIWAYYELGWGGWWFWDPVENASFMPWLVGAALAHSLIVTEKRGGMAAWTVFLAVLAFCLSILGAFLVRSGVLTSVHAFAVDPERGMILLVGLAVVAGGAFALYAWRAPSLKAGPEYDPVSREGMLVLNNLFLSVGAALVLLGTVLPLFAQAADVSISIGEPYFLLTFAPMMAALFLLLPLTQAATWRRTEIKPLLKQFWPAALLAVVVGVGAFVIWGRSFWLVPGIAVGVWVVVGVLLDLRRRVGVGGFGRLAKLSLGVWGMAIAHLGVGVFVIGATAESATRIEQTFALRQGESAELRGWTFRFDGVQDVEGPNYYATRAQLTATHDGRTTVMLPEKRIYPVAGTPTTEVAIRKTAGGDVYVALGDNVREDPSVWRVRIAHHPLIDWVFGGAGLIAIGGFLSLAARVRRSSPAPLAEGEAAQAAASRPAEAST